MFKGLEMKILYGALGVGFAAVAGVGYLVLPGDETDRKSCEFIAKSLNNNYLTVKAYDETNQLIPDDSGIIVHTIHGPTTDKVRSDTDIDKLNALEVDENKTCLELIKAGHYLPWCGSNRDPKSGDFSDTSSWSYLRKDTLVNVKGRDEVMCSMGNNRRYGVIFSNHYMNKADNLGCLYPVDADTVNREKKACGVDTKANEKDRKGFCAPDITKDKYLSSYNNFVSKYGADARKYTCSLSKDQFDVWVDVRKDLTLTSSPAPVDEFVLYNWGQQSTKQLADNGYIVGIYYLTGCVGTPPDPSILDANKEDAQKIANLYEKWSGSEIPVLELSNKNMRDGATPFSCSG